MIWEVILIVFGVFVGQEYGNKIVSVKQTIIQIKNTFESLNTTETTSLWNKITAIIKLPKKDD